MTMLGHVKKGLLNFLSRTSLTLLANQRGSPRENWRTFTNLDQTILTLMAQETAFSSELKRIREELGYMTSCTRTRCILINTDFGRKALMSLENTPGVGMKMDEIETLTRKFERLSAEEGELLNRLEITKTVLRKLSKQQRDSEMVFKAEVARMSREKSIACFEIMREATQYFELLDYLKQKRHITHTSTSEEILKTLTKELRNEFPYLKERLLKHGIDDHIFRLRRLHEAELAYKFCLFLPLCNIEDNAKTFAADVELIKQSADFQREFSELPDYSIASGLFLYRQHLKEKCVRDEEKWKSAYVEDLKKRLDCKKSRYLQLRNPFRDLVYEMVFVTRKKDYHVDVNGDPETDVAELEKCFNEIPNSELADMYGDSEEFDDLFDEKEWLYC